MVCVAHVGILCDIPVLGMKYKNKRFEMSVSIIKINSWKCQCNGYYAVSVCLLRCVWMPLIQLLVEDTWHFDGHLDTLNAINLTSDEVHVGLIWPFVWGKMRSGPIVTADSYYLDFLLMTNVLYLILRKTYSSSWGSPGTFVVNKNAHV